MLEVDGAVAVVGGQRFTLHHARPSGVALYRGEGAYMRVGPPHALEPEYRAHVRLLALGFPVAALLDRGEAGGQFYFVEESLGAETFGDRFDSETGRGGVTEASFAAFLAVVRRYAAAQLRGATAADGRTGDAFAGIARLDQALDELPDLRGAALRGFARAVERLSAYPSVETHPDLHAYNVCAGGVIDLEGVTRGYAGYDVIGALLVPELFPPAPGAYGFSPPQRARYLAAVDALYAEHDLPPPSATSGAIRLCKLLSSVVGRRGRPAQRRWLVEHCRAALAPYG
jgi:Phosphotransferase enzyme family